jgi:predicted nucleotidyltransferase
MTLLRGPRALYAAFDRFPTRKGASTHIARFAPALFTEHGGGLLAGRMKLRPLLRSTAPARARGYTDPEMTTSGDLESVRRIVLDGLRGYECGVVLFGSQATGTARPTSEIEVGVLPRQPLPAWVLARVRDALEESSVLATVDVVDLSKASETLREAAVREGMP